MSNQIRDLVHTIKTTDLTPAQIQSAFGEIYLSKDTIENQLETQEIVSNMQVVKVPTYGQHIPNSASITRSAGASGVIDLVSATVNKSYKILAVSVESASTDPNPVQVGLYDGQSDFVALYQGEAIPTGVTAIPNVQNVTFDSTIYPAAIIESGDVNDYTFRIAYAEIVQ